MSITQTGLTQGQGNHSCFQVNRPRIETYHSLRDTGGERRRKVTLVLASGTFLQRF